MNVKNQLNSIDNRSFYAIKFNPNQEKTFQNLIYSFIRTQNSDKIKLLPYFPTLIELSFATSFITASLIKESISSLQATRLEQDEDFIFLNWIITEKNGNKSSGKMIICKKKSSGERINLSMPEDFIQTVKIFRILLVAKEGFKYSFLDEKWCKLK